MDGQYPGLVKMPRRRTELIIAATYTEEAVQRAALAHQVAIDMSLVFRHRMSIVREKGLWTTRRTVTGKHSARFEKEYAPY